MSAVGFDIHKAFDTVPFSKLLDCLRHEFNVPECLLGWLASYYDNRKQAVQVNRCMSSWRPVKAGVVQGGIIRKHILNFLVENRSIRSNQHGFFPRRSTLTNLLCFLDNITSNLDEGVVTDIVYLDIAKAFDTIPHDKLLCCLNRFGITEQLFRWVKYFFD